VVILLVTVALLALIRLGWMPAGMPRRSRRVAGRRKKRAESRDVAFYQRLEKLLSGHGLHRQSSQTAREFADQAGQTIAVRTGSDQVRDCVLQVTDAYYRVRFGHLTLDENQAAAVAQSTRRIEESLKRKD
jgi:hypothetical protein